MAILTIVVLSVENAAASYFVRFSVAILHSEIGRVNASLGEERSDTAGRFKVSATVEMKG
jgi:hypothetical protein